LSSCQQPAITAQAPRAPEPAPPDKGIAGIVSLTPEAAALSRKIQRYAVIIGINDYKYSPRIRDLKYAARDARELHSFLTSPAGGGFPRGNVKPLIDRDATIKNVRSALYDFLSAPVEQDIVVIYFTGHGAPDPKNPNNLYLLCHDTEPDRFGGTALAMREIDTALKWNIKSQRVVVLTDACHSAGIGETVTKAMSQEAAERWNEYWRKLAGSRTGITKITASESDQLSQEGVQWGGGHGVFTYHLLEALKGNADGWSDRQKDGFVTIAEAYEYLRDRVRRETRNAQCPWASPYKDHSIPFGIVDPAVQQSVAARQRAEERESITQPVVSVTSVQVPVESDKALALAMAYLKRSKDSEAREIVETVLRRHDRAEPDAMAMMVDFLLQDGNVDQAEDLQLRVCVTHPQSDKARVAARMVYDYYRNQMGDLPIPDQMKVLARFLKRNPDSAHAKEAGDMLAELKGKLRSSYQGMLDGHLKMAQTRAARGELDKAEAELAQARAAVAEALRDHGLRLDAAPIGQAEAEVADAKNQAQYAAAFASVKAKCSRLSLLECAKAWQQFLRDAAGNPHRPEAQQALDEARAQLQSQLQRQLEQALARGESQIQTKQFADAQRSLDGARKAIADAAQIDGLSLTGGDKLPGLATQFAAESAKHRDYVAYQAALDAARQAMARGETADTYAAALKAHATFQAENPTSRYRADSRQEASDLEANLKAWRDRSYTAAMNAAQAALSSKSYETAGAQVALALTHRPGDRAAQAFQAKLKPVLVVTAVPWGRSPRRRLPRRHAHRLHAPPLRRPDQEPHVHGLGRKTRLARGAAAGDGESGRRILAFLRHGGEQAAPGL